MKLCKDCIHSDESFCYRRYKSKLNYSTGKFEKTYIKNTFISSERSNSIFFKKCGPEAKFFEQRSNIDINEQRIENLKNFITNDLGFSEKDTDEISTKIKSIMGQ